MAQIQAAAAKESVVSLYADEIVELHSFITSSLRWCFLSHLKVIDNRYINEKNIANIRPPEINK